MWKESVNTMTDILYTAFSWNVQQYFSQMCNCMMMMMMMMITNIIITTTVTTVAATATTNAFPHHDYDHDHDPITITTITTTTTTATTIIPIAFRARTWPAPLWCTHRLGKHDSAIPRQRGRPGGTSICNYIYYKVWDEITYPFPNFNGTAVEVWEWIWYFILHFIEPVITYPRWD